MHEQWFTSLIVLSLTLPERSLPSCVPPISSSSLTVFAQDRGRLGMLGVFHPSTLVAFSYAGVEGVPGSDGYTLIY
jgi:hypothetical protein